MLKPLPSLVFAALLTFHSAPATAAENVIDLGKWAIVKRGGASFVGVENGLIVSGGRGWAHAKLPLMDFVARLEFRAATPDAEAGIVVRGGVLEPNTWPAFGYRISIADPTNTKIRLGSVQGYEKRVRPVPDGQAVLPASQPGQWHTLVVSCEGDTLTVTIDGTLVNKVQGEEHLAGYLGIEHKRGVLEFREMRVVPLPVGGRCAGELDVEKDFPGVRPALLKEVKPHYPLAAKLARKQGPVRLRVDVDTEGLPKSVCVDKALDPELDAFAIAAARRWRFTPALLGDQPIEFAVTLEMTFTLRY